MFFFFKQKTAYEMRISDWSSDVCSSDLSAGRNRWCCWASWSNRISRTAREPPRAHPIQPNRSNAMSYIDGFVIAVPTANRQKFIEHAKTGDSVFIDYGATRVLECWGDRKSTRLNSSH